MSLLLWIFALSSVLLVLRFAAGGTLVSRSTKLLFLPGVLIAIAARALCCALSGATLKSVNLPWREGPPLDNEPPHVPVWGDALFATVPLAAAAWVVLRAFDAFGSPVRLDVQLPSMDASLDSIGVFMQTSVAIVRAMMESSHHVFPDDWRLFGWLYVAVSALVFAAPSVAEWRALGWLTAAVCAFLSFFGWLGLTPAFLSRGWFVKFLYEDPSFDAVARLMEVAILATIAFAAVRGAWALGLAIARPAGGGRRRAK